MVVQRKYERDIDLLLAEEFSVTPGFANWFLEKTSKIDHAGAAVADVAVSASDAAGESDLVVIYKVAEGPSLALLIEDKIDAGFQKNQFERYKIRGERGVSRGDFDGFQIVLCAPRTYFDSSPRAALFGTFVSYEDIAEAIERVDGSARGAYRANFLRTAATRSANNYVRIDDEPTNAFWDAAYKLASTRFPSLEMKPYRRSKNSNWISFRPHDLPSLPKRVTVDVKGALGCVDLTFGSTSLHLFEPHIRHILDGRTVHQTGQACAIRLGIAPFLVTDGIEVGLPKVEKAFSVATKCVEFYRENRDILNQAAEDATPRG